MSVGSNFLCGRPPGTDPMSPSESVNLNLTPPPPHGRHEWMAPYVLQASRDRCCNTDLMSSGDRNMNCDPFFVVADLIIMPIVICRLTMSYKKTDVHNADQSNNQSINPCLITGK